jgi:hypothetical protein
MAERPDGYEATARAVAAERERDELRDEHACLRGVNERYMVALQNIATGMRGIDDGSHEKMAARLIATAKRALGLRAASPSADQVKDR